MRTTITKSRRGHYSATVRRDDGTLIGRESLLPTLWHARKAAERIIAADFQRRQAPVCASHLMGGVV